MMDFNPRKWRSTRMIRGYTYSMKHDAKQTLEKLRGIQYHIVERRFFHQPSAWHDDTVWGWIKFKEPLHLWECHGSRTGSHIPSGGKVNERC